MLEYEGQEVTEDEDGDCELMEKAYREAAEATLGKPTEPRQKRKPWISKKSGILQGQKEEINKILSTRSEQVKTKLRARYKGKYREVKRNIKDIKADKKKWMESIASDAEEAARSQNKTTLNGLRKTYCTCNEVEQGST